MADNLTVSWSVVDKATGNRIKSGCEDMEGVIILKLHGTKVNPDGHFDIAKLTGPMLGQLFKKFTGGE